MNIGLSSKTQQIAYSELTNVPKIEQEILQKNKQKNSKLFWSKVISCGKETK